MSNSVEKKLTKKDLLKVFIRWETGTEACNSYERLMSLGFCWSMVPIIKKLYDTKEERVAALNRHLVFFNTENNWGAFIPGIVCSLEEERANSKDISDEAINGIKVGLMGPLAGMGDTITQILVNVVLLSVIVNMTLNGNLFAPIIYVIIYTAYILGVGYFTFTQGYSLGRNVLSKIMDKSILQKLTECMSVLGMTIAGSMIVSNVNITTPLVITTNESSIVLNDILTSIAPNILGVLTVAIVFSLLRKKISINKIIVGIFFIGLIGSLLGIL